MADQLTLGTGEPRYTKIKGQARYYDHLLGKSISHRQYWKLRGGKTQPRDAWTPQKASRLVTGTTAKNPTPVRAAPATSSSSDSGPSLLAQKLLADSMLGAPIVETPPAPQMAKELAGDISEDIRKDVAGLAQAVTPTIALIIVAIATLFLPEHLGWARPDQDEAELVIEPAARIILRRVGLTGKALGPDGQDIIALGTAVAAYVAGATSRMQDYLAAMGEYEREPEPDTRTSRRARTVDERPGTERSNGHTGTTPDYASATLASHASVLDQLAGRSGGQSNEATNTASRPKLGRGSVPTGTAKQSLEAAKVADLLQADFAGRLRMGLN